MLGHSILNNNFGKILFVTLEECRVLFHVKCTKDLEEYWSVFYFFDISLFRPLEARIGFSCWRSVYSQWNSPDVMRSILYRAWDGIIKCVCDAVFLPSKFYEKRNFVSSVPRI